MIIVIWWFVRQYRICKLLKNAMKGFLNVHRLHNFDIHGYRCFSITAIGL